MERVLQKDTLRAFDTGKDSRETIEKQQEEIRKLKLQVEYLQYALNSMDSKEKQDER